MTPTNEQPKKHIVSFSGGRTSAYMVHLMEQKRVTKGMDVEYIFMDTGAEHPKTYDFVRDVIKQFGINLICLRAVVNPVLGEGIDYKVVDPDDLKFDLSLFKVLMKKHGNFTVNRPYCTARLKTQVFDKYCNENFGKKQWTPWIGIRADEPKRLPDRSSKTLSSHHQKKAEMNYLADISNFTKEDILDFWKEQTFDLGLGGDQHLGNCVFCVKKGANKIALAARDEPELWAQWVELVTDSDNVRAMPADKFGIGHIYRQWTSPDKIIGMFADSTDAELRERIYKTKQLDTGDCTESCEVFGVQLNLFSEEAA